MRLRRIARGLGIVLAVLVAIVALSALGGALWMRSSMGRTWLVGRLTTFIGGKIHGKLTVARVTGPLWGWAVLEDAHLYDAEGNPVGHAAQIAIDFDPWTAPRHRLHIRRLYVIDPDLKVKPIADGRLHLEVLGRFLRERQRSLRIDGLVLENTRMHLRPLEGPLDALDQTRIVSRLFFVEHTRWGRMDLLDVDGRMHLQHGPPRPLVLDATVRWDPETRVAADAIHIHAGDTRIEGKASLQKDRFDLDLTRLHVVAGDFHQVVPVEDPPGNIDGRVAIHGKLHHLAVDLLLHPGDGTVHLRGHANWPQKMLTATVDHDQLRGAYFPTRPPFVINARVQLRVKWDGHGLVGPVALENGAGSVKNVEFQKGSAVAVFFADGVDFARAGLEIPGGSVSGHAHITFKGLIRLDARLNVTEPKKLYSAIRGKIELPSPARDRSVLTIDVELNKQPKQKPHFAVKSLGLGRPVARGRDGQPL